MHLGCLGHLGAVVLVVGLELNSATLIVIASSDLPRTRGREDTLVKVSSIGSSREHTAQSQALLQQTLGRIVRDNLNTLIGGLNFLDEQQEGLIGVVCHFDFNGVLHVGRGNRRAVVVLSVGAQVNGVFGIGNLNRVACSQSSVRSVAISVIKIVQSLAAVAVSSHNGSSAYANGSVSIGGRVSNTSGDGTATLKCSRSGSRSRRAARRTASGQPGHDCACGNHRARKERAP